MNKLAVFLFTPMLLVVQAAPLFAAEGGSGSPLLDFLFKVINFAVLFGAIYYFAKKPLAHVLQNSATTAKQNLDEAREAQQQVEAELEVLREKLAHMQQEAQTMVEDAKKEATAEKERIIAEGRALAEKMQEQAKAAIAQEYKKAESELRRWTAEETVKLAEQQIKARIDDSHQDHLVKNFLNQL